jgi:signal peptidase II
MPKKFIFNFITILVIFITDRVTKIYILKIADFQNSLDIFVTSYLNFYLVWNKGIAFGLFSFEQSSIYKIITLIILIITLIILVMIINNSGLKRYALISIFGGSISNLFDRIYYSAVPDFIDLHINNFHWFIFNVADIFITAGVICLIYAEIFDNKRVKIKNE